MWQLEASTATVESQPAEAAAKEAAVGMMGLCHDDEMEVEATEPWWSPEFGPNVLADATSPHGADCPFPSGQCPLRRWSSRRLPAGFEPPGMCVCMLASGWQGAPRLRDLADRTASMV